MSEGFVAPTPLETAVLFLVFNRPDTTKQVFEAIKLAKPPRLYVAADGPRAGKEGEAERVEQVRKIATAVDWPCSVKTLFRQENFGCKNAVRSAIDWFFENEEMGIVLEDDCLPHPFFFEYCEKMLQHYQDDSTVYVVTGDNFQEGIWRGNYSYYFSRFNHVWGWATWRRAWKTYDVSMAFWPEWKKSEGWKRWVPDKVERRYWEKIFDKSYKGLIDTWDYQWTASIWHKGGLTATPNVNLVLNIGFGLDATHTKCSVVNVDALHSDKINKLKKIDYSPLLEVDHQADKFTFDAHFNGFLYRMPYAIIFLPMRIFRLIKRKINPF